MGSTDNCAEQARLKDGWYQRTADLGWIVVKFEGPMESRHMRLCRQLLGGG